MHRELSWQNYGYLTLTSITQLPYKHTHQQLSKIGANDSLIACNTLASFHPVLNSTADFTWPFSNSQALLALLGTTSVVGSGSITSVAKMLVSFEILICGLLLIVDNRIIIIIIIG